MKIMGLRKQAAFTLAELLVVTAVLAVLVALILPQARNLFDRATASSCAASLRQFGSAVLLYRADHNGYFPPGRLLPPIDTTLIPANSPQAGVDIVKDLTQGGYLKANELPYCPAMRLSKTGYQNLKPGEAAQSIFKAKGSYAMNLFLTQTKVEALPGPYFGSYPYPGDSKMLLASEVYFTGITNSIDHQNITLNGMDYGTLYNYAPRSHGKNGLNFMFLDGHIAMLSPKVTTSGTKVWQVRNNNDLSDPEIPFDSWGRNGKYIQQRTAYGTYNP